MTYHPVKLRLAVTLTLLALLTTSAFIIRSGTAAG
jgi:hypothetical protein